MSDLIQQHGGNIWAYSQNILDFSASLNPLGMPEEVAEAARQGVCESTAYPDPECIRLRQSISEMDHVPMDCVFCGSGAAELLTRLVLAIRPKAAMVTAPTFGEYERALSVVNARIFYHYLKPERQFDVTENLLRTLRSGVDMLFLCNPNNPTGRPVETGLLHHIIEVCEEKGIYLVLDESFLPLTEGASLEGAVPYLSDHPHLILLRSMTKTFAMPGLRLGYLLTSDAALMERLRDCGQPWNVSLPAQRAGEVACRLVHWAKQGRAMITRQRKLLEQALTDLGFRVIPSSVNYILFQVPGDTALKDDLLEHNILIRSCASFTGLGEDWYRIAVRTSEENQTLIAALTQRSKVRRKE